MQSHCARAGVSGPPLAGPPGGPNVVQGLLGSSDRPRYSTYIRSTPVPLPPMLLLIGCSIRTQAHDWTGATVGPPVKLAQSTTPTVAHLRSPPTALKISGIRDCSICVQPGSGVSLIRVIGSSSAPEISKSIELSGPASCCVGICIAGMIGNRLTLVDAASVNTKAAVPIRRQRGHDAPLTRLRGCNGKITGTCTCHISAEFGSSPA